MSEEIRKLVRKLNKSVLGILNSPRRVSKLPISATLEIEHPTGDLRKKPQPLVIQGMTQDLSKTGIAFVVPFIRLGEHYFVGDEQRLLLEIELPEGTVKMNVIAKRYEILGEHDSVSSYLIGARIVSMLPQYRELWENYLKYGFKKNRKKDNPTGELRPNESSSSV
jgi:hypothetical protein